MKLKHEQKQKHELKRNTINPVGSLKCRACNKELKLYEDILCFECRKEVELIMEDYEIEHSTYAVNS